MIKPLYKPGDRVVVVSKMDHNRRYGMNGEPEDEKMGSYIEAREEFFGETLTIKKVHKQYYEVEDLGSMWIWTDEMFVGLEEDVQTDSLEFDLEAILGG